MTTIGVIGGGAWGTALAQAMCVAGKDVTLWAREPEVVAGIRDKHENTLYLPGVTLHPSLKVTASMAEAAAADIILMVTPAQLVCVPASAPLKARLMASRLSCAPKGLSLRAGFCYRRSPSKKCPKPMSPVLSGPTFAAEIARGLPSAVTLAAENKEMAHRLVQQLGCRNLRPYASEDVVGAQLGGAVKNVLAIACGVVYGKELGDSARAALLTRGISEMARLASAMGADKGTLMGMCGIGDLMLTASSMQSRNFSLGVMLGQGRSLDDIMKERVSVTEGVHTAKALMTLAKNHAVEMPVCETMFKILHNGLSVDDAIMALLDRPYGTPE